MQTVLITGGTGMVGKELSKLLLEKGYSLIILTRNSASQQSTNKQLRYANWDIKKQTINLEAFQTADYIIHLAGAGVVDKKWTDSYKKEIVDSRTESSKLLVNTLAKYPHHVKAIITSSAIGWYGPDVNGANAFTETSPSSTDFLGETCRLWEESIEGATKLGVRVCKLRTGIVLSNTGGALSEFKKPIKFGVAGILGNGKQVVSWIHIEDLCRMFLFALENKHMEGSYNAVAPNPVSNQALTLTLARMMRGSFFIPLNVPVFILKIMMGKRSIEVLKSTKVSCEKIKKAGFSFVYPSIEAALHQLIKNNYKYLFTTLRFPSQ